MPLNPKMKLWNKLVSEYRKKHGVSLKEAMQAKSVKAEYARKKKSMGPDKTSPKRSSRRKVSPKRSSRRRSSPRTMTSPKRRKYQSSQKKKIINL